MKLGILAIVAGLFLCACGNSAFTHNATAIDPSTGWVSWSKQSQAVFTGSSRIVSDPAVVVDDTGFRMAYTAINFGENGAVPHASIALATSEDSLTWTPLASNLATASTSLRGEVLRGRPGEWDENLETPFLLKTSAGYYLYYSGYRDGLTPGEPAKGFPASLGVAFSRDGVNFTRVQSEPILTPTPESFDSDAVYSPDITPYQNGYLMVYAGHCYKNCPGAPGVRVLGATSADGIHWIKLSEPLLSPKAPPEWMRDGVAEPAILLGPDNHLYLFFTGVKDQDIKDQENVQQQHVIGVARAASLTSAWDVDPEPIVSPTPGGFDETGDAAPTVILENNQVRVWFVGTNHAAQYSIGYAEAPWPLRHQRARQKAPAFATVSPLTVKAQIPGLASHLLP
jgi:hypothetical protein